LKLLSISTTLVMTVMPSIDDDQIGEVIQHVLQWKCERGMTLQHASEASVARMKCNAIRGKLGAHTIILGLLPSACIRAATLRGHLQCGR